MAVLVCGPQPSDNNYPPLSSTQGAQVAVLVCCPQPSDRCPPSPCAGCTCGGPGMRTTAIRPLPPLTMCRAHGWQSWCAARSHPTLVPPSPCAGCTSGSPGVRPAGHGGRGETAVRSGALWALGGAGALRGAYRGVPALMMAAPAGGGGGHDCMFGP